MFSVSACEAASVQTVSVETQSLHHASPDRYREHLIMNTLPLVTFHTNRAQIRLFKGSKALTVYT